MHLSAIENCSPNGLFGTLKAEKLFMSHDDQSCCQHLLTIQYNYRFILAILCNDHTFMSIYKDLSRNLSKTS